ncbi:MAG: ATP-binding protein [Candidatus Thorarchaeota archaeon]
MVTRLMIQINEDKCTGCGLCVPNCAEGALAVVDGVAKVVSESYCDGLGACLGECPEGALALLEVETVEFDEEAAMEYVAKVRGNTESSGCPGEQVLVYETQHAHETHDNVVPTEARESELAHWPIKLRLLSPQHPALKGASLLLLADCAAAAYSGLHEDFLHGKTVAMWCPKFEDYTSNVQKLAMMLKENDVKDLSVVHMEVPCCGSLARTVEEAVTLSGVDIPLRKFIIGVRGNIRAVI